jgi:hypothetical protein
VYTRGSPISELHLLTISIHKSRKGTNHEVLTRYEWSCTKKQLMKSMSRIISGQVPSVFVSYHVGKCCDSSLTQATTASLYILSTSRFQTYSSINTT